MGQNRLQGFVKNTIIQWKRSEISGRLIRVSSSTHWSMRRALAIPWRRFGAAVPLRLRSLRSGRPLGRWMAAGVAVAVVYRSKMHDYRCSENSQATQ